MLKSTEEALLKLEKFLTPQPTDLLLDPQDPDSESKVAAANGSSLAAALGLDSITENPAHRAAFLRSPLVTIINQILGAQGDNQTIFAMEQMSNMLLGDELQARYEINLLNQTPAPGADPTPLFNGILQSPAGGFVIQDHTAVMTMYPEGEDGLRTPKVINATKESPTKYSPTFGYIAIIDPRLNYSRTSADIASTMTRAIPSLEFSKCVPFFKLSIMTPSSTVNTEDDETITSDMSYGKFFEAQMPGGLSGKSGRTNVKGFPDGEFKGVNDDQKRWTGTTSVGMEAFTMPQSIVPTGQGNDAWNNEFGTGYTSIDRTRPFMSINSFSVTITGTRGASAAQRAKLELTLHDRGRLSQIKSLLKPATLNQVEFTVEYGWAHPDSGLDSNNVYGTLINSMRNKATYTLSNSGYAFQDDGQVKIALDMVTKGIEAINVVDTSTTGRLAPLSKAVEVAYDALATARAVAGNVLTRAQMGGQGAVQTINTLTLNNVGTLISSDTADSIQEWIYAAQADGSSVRLQELGLLLEKVRDAASDMSAAMIQDLEVKLGVLSSKSYSNWHAFVQTGLLPADPWTAGNLTPKPPVNFYNTTKNEALPAGWTNQNGNYAPLAALLQLFVVHPLYETGLYDEVQLVTYTANTTAGAAACANLGSIPVDLQKIAGSDTTTFKKVLVNEYKRQGGQYPINRMIDFINRMFIEPHMSVCYGFAAANKADGVTGNSGINYNMATGEVTFDEVSENVQSNISKLLRKYYYDDVYEGDPFNRRPTDFTPINLRLIFDVSKSTPEEITSRGPAGPREITMEEAARLGEKTVLRIHVIDEAATERPDIMNFLKNTAMITSGIIIPNTPKISAGMSESLRQILFGDAFNLNDDSMTCKKLEEQGILEAYSDAPPLTDPTVRANLTARKTAFVALLGDTSKTPRQLRRINDYIATIDSRLSTTNNVSDVNAYFLAASPHRLIRFCSQAAPNIVYGEEGSVVQQISIKSGGSSRQNSMFMRRALETGATGDNEPSRGVPMRMKPAEMSIDMLGNPNVKYRQNFFINTGTGTSIDNLYAVSGLSHNITPDSFKTSIKLVNQDAYGVFNNLISNIDEVAGAVTTLQSQMSAERLRRINRRAGGGVGARNSRLGTTISDEARNALSGAQAVALATEQIKDFVRYTYWIFKIHQEYDEASEEYYAAEMIARRTRYSYGPEERLFFIPQTTHGPGAVVFEYNDSEYRKYFFNELFSTGDMGFKTRLVNRAAELGISANILTEVWEEHQDADNFPHRKYKIRFTYDIYDRDRIAARMYNRPVNSNAFSAIYEDESQLGDGTLPTLFHPLDRKWTDRYRRAGLEEYLTLTATEVNVSNTGDAEPKALTIYKFTSYLFVNTPSASLDPEPDTIVRTHLPDEGMGGAMGTGPNHMNLVRFVNLPQGMVTKHQARNAAIKEIVARSRETMANIRIAGTYTPAEQALFDGATIAVPESVEFVEIPSTAEAEEAARALTE